MITPLAYLRWKNKKKMGWAKFFSLSNTLHTVSQCQDLYWSWWSKQRTTLPLTAQPQVMSLTHRGMLVWSWWMSVCCLSLSVDPDSVYKGCTSVHTNGQTHTGHYESPDCTGQGWHTLRDISAKNFKRAILNCLKWQAVSGGTTTNAFKQSQTFLRWLTHLCTNSRLTKGLDSSVTPMIWNAPWSQAVHLAALQLMNLI